MAFVAQTTGIGTLAYPFYVGESADAKPTPAESVQNATLYETDTRRHWIWSGRDRQWIPFRDEQAALDAILRLADEVRGMRADLKKLIETQRERECAFGN